ncbi:plant intracellular Ras-group-related LRR protein 5-like [Rhodamnia argentea]|uniref:Plant intracellular Ras-group-related LRR protein 5-like n=1 Tax=Rhodamnia argentea TaxID=178133 RepID=A0ABM3GZD3_9MYRT|nr:plant intracellular Ras-group-related LRR protein 5-like [Rhodamnia argentea]
MHVGELHHSIGEMTRLKYLSLSSSALTTLPDSIGKLKFLLELDLDGTGITELPHSIGDLKMLTKMSLVMAPMKRLPNSIGGLESLIELNLEDTHIIELPACIGNLKRLEVLHLSGTALRVLPKTIGMLENLKRLEASCCQNLEGEIPSEIGGLCCLRTLNLSWSNIRRLPATMNQLSHLQQLHLVGCHGLEQIPELPVSLKELEFPPHLLWTAPDLSYLTTLVNLHITEKTPQLLEFIRGFPKIEWIEELSSLERLEVIMRDVTFPPINLATLSRLRVLKITCVEPRSLMGLPSSLEELCLFDVKWLMERSLFSNLTNLSSLELRNCRLREVEFDDVLGQQLVKLHGLGVRDSELIERLSMPTLKGLQRLIV